MSVVAVGGMAERRYELLNGFRSDVVASGAAAQPLYTLATTPARTAGLTTVVYTLIIENGTGQDIIGWLEIGGVQITPGYHVSNGNTVVIPFIAGLNLGNNDINCNADNIGVAFQILGIEA